MAQAGPFVPPVIRFGDQPTATFGNCVLDGQSVAYGARVLVDECVECQCTTFGLRCRKRASCPDDRCVFVDGQVVARGGNTVVDACFDCVCGADGPACSRRTDAPCPVEGCKLASTVLPIGAQQFVSECHVCDCDAATGLSCRNLCHSVCSCNAGEPGVCAEICDRFTCPLEIADQDRVELACGSAVCDYHQLLVETVGCP